MWEEEVILLAGAREPGWCQGQGPLYFCGKLKMHAAFEIAARSPFQHKCLARR